MPPDADDEAAVAPSVPEPALGAPPHRARRRLRRTWPQRLVIGFNVVVVLACVATAVGLRYGYATVSAINRVIIDRGPDVISQQQVWTGANGVVNSGFSEAPPGELSAENFLLVGVDQRGCTSSNPQYAGAFIDEGEFRNTDTIIVVRTDPATGQAAMLSFPRDLWVRGPDSQARGKLNSFFADANDPNPLIKVLGQNFGIIIDHYVAIDFCAFRDLVDAVGPIRIPFAYPARDKNTGFAVDVAECWELDGEAALAYARSRNYEWQDADGDWNYDQTGDYGRQARQQDFMRRVLRRAIDSGARDPGKLQQLVRIGLEYIIVDQDLTAQDVYDLGRAFDHLDPAAIPAYSIVGEPETRDGTYIETFDLEEPPNADIVAVFRGQARLVVPEAPVDEAAVAAPPGEALPVAAAPGAVAQADPVPPADGGLPEVSVEPANDITDGSILPPNDPACT